MRLKNGLNYIDVGSVDCIEELKELALSENLDRKTIREAGTSPQRETNVAVGLFDMIDFIDGVCNTQVMDRYDPYIPQIIEQLKEFYEYEFIQIKSFVIIKLRAGAKIHPHRDDRDGDTGEPLDSSYSFCHRLHIPVQTNPDVIFNIGGEESHLEYGRITEINNLEEHTVVNNGESDRVHILIDFYGIDGFYDKFLSSVPKEFYIK